MSAWVVSKKHIDYVVTAAIAAELIPGSKADETGRMLWLENLRSVAYRYPRDGDGERPGPIGFHDREAKDYTWTETPVLTGGALNKTLGCLNYQSCECPDYEGTDAAKLLASLRAPVEDQVFPDEVPWGW